MGVDSAGVDLAGVDSAGADPVGTVSAGVEFGIDAAELVAGIVVPVASGAVQGTVPVTVIAWVFPSMTIVDTIVPWVEHSVPVGTGRVREHTVV